MGERAGLGDSRSATRALRRVAAALDRVAQRRLDGREGGERVDLLRAGGAAPGEDDGAPQQLLRGLELAGAGGEPSGDGCRERAHPVLRERLALPQRVGGGDPAARAGDVAGAERSPRACPRHAAPPCCSRRPARRRSPARAAARPRRRARPGSTARRRAWRARRPARPTPAPSSSSTARAPTVSAAREVARPIGERRAQHRDARRHRRAALQQRAPVLRRLGRPRPALGDGGLAGVERQPGAREAQPRIAFDDVLRQGVEPPGDGRAAPGLQPRVPGRGDEVGARPGRAGREQVVTAVETSPASGAHAPARACSSAIVRRDRDSCSSRRRTSRKTWW